MPPAWLPACLLALLLAVAAPLRAEAPPAALSPDTHQLDLLPHLSVLEDPSAAWSLDAVRDGPPSTGFTPLGEHTASFGYTRSAYWLRARLRNDGPARREWVLRQSYALLDHVEVHVVRADGPREQWASGDRLPFASRPIAHRDYLFPFALEAGEQVDVFVRARSEGPVNVELDLYDPAALVPALAAENLALGALFGSFALLALGTLLLLAFVRDEAFAYYMAYIGGYAAYMAVFNGLAYQYVWPASPAFAAVAQVVLLMLALHFLLLFARSLLRVRGLSRGLDFAYLALQTLVFALMVASPFFSYGLLVKPITATVGASILMVIAFGIAGHRAGQRSARWFLLAWSAFLGGVLLYLLKSVGLLPHNALTQYGFQIGTVFEFVLLTVALGVRVREIRHESRTDSLTGLANRSRYDELMPLAFARHRATGEPLSLLVLDVDHFKRINDGQGHAAGDRTLEAVAQALRQTTPAPFEVCRYGGEEFVVVMPGAPLDEALALAERLRQAVSGEHAGAAVTLSAGVASTQDHPFADPRGLFRAADEALYTAKRSGRDRVLAWRGPGVVAGPGGDMAATSAAH